jgi:chromosome segregation ATPase
LRVGLEFRPSHLFSLQQVRLEHEEEAITNQLMKRIDRLREEKEAVVAAVDREEEYISNTLQKQLSALMREKLQLEEKLQHEEAEHAEVLKRLTDTFNQRMSERNKLQSERCTIENQLEQEQERIINSMSSQVQALLTERGKLKRDNERLRGQLRSLGVSRSVSPATSRGYPSPASSPRNPPVMGTAGFGDPPPAPLSQH